MLSSTELEAKEVILRIYKQVIAQTDKGEDQFLDSQYLKPKMKNARWIIIMKLGKRKNSRSSISL